MATLCLRKPLLLIRPLALGLGLIIATAVSADTGNQTKQETGDNHSHRAPAHRSHSFSDSWGRRRRVGQDRSWGGPSIDPI